MRAWAKVILLLLGIALTAWGIVYGYNSGKCALYGSSTERETRYSGFVGCMVKTSNGWVPRTELRTAAE